MEKSSLEKIFDELIDSIMSRVAKKVTDKNKPRPTRDEVVEIVEAHFANCGCESDGHNIREPRNGYIYIITREKDFRKDKSKS